MENDNLENERGKKKPRRNLIVVIFFCLVISMLLGPFIFVKIKNNLKDDKNTDEYYVSNVPETPENTFYIPLKANDSNSTTIGSKRYLKLRLLGEEKLPDGVISVINKGHAKKAMILKNAIKLYNSNGYEIDDIQISQFQSAFSSPEGNYFLVDEIAGKAPINRRPYGAIIYNDIGSKIGAANHLPFPSSLYISDNTDLIVIAGQVASLGQPYPGLVYLRKNGTIIKDFGNPVIEKSAFSFKHNIFVGYCPAYRNNDAKLMFINQKGAIIRSLDLSSFAIGRRVVRLFMSDDYAFVLTAPSQKGDNSLSDFLYKSVDLYVFDISGDLIHIVKDILNSPIRTFYVNNKDNIVSLYSDAYDKVEIVVYNANSNKIVTSYKIANNDGYYPSFVLYTNKLQLLFLCGLKPKYSNNDIIVLRIVDHSGNILFEYNIAAKLNNEIAYYPSLSVNAMTNIMTLTYGSFRKYMTIEEIVK